MSLNKLFMIAFCFAATACSSIEFEQAKFFACAEKQLVTDSWIGTIRDIGDLSEAPSEKNVRKVIRPLWKQFNIDEGRCQGYTEKIRDASKNFLKKREVEISSTLLRVCSLKFDGSIVDVSALAAMQEEQFGATIALRYLGRSTGECLGAGAGGSD